MQEIAYDKRFNRTEIAPLNWEDIPKKERALLINAAKITMGVIKKPFPEFCKARDWLFDSGFELYDIPYEMLYPTEISMDQVEMNFNQ